MHDRKLRTLVMRWVMPSFLFVVILIIILMSFWKQSQKSVQTIVHNNIEQTGGTYSRNISAELAPMIRVSDTMALMLERRINNSIYYLLKSLDAMSAVDDRYSVVYCYRHGVAVTEAYEEINLRGTDYYNLLVSEPYLGYTRDDGITGEAAIFYASPVEYSEKLAGYLISYMKPGSLDDIFADGKSYGDDVFYAIVDSEGQILGAYGGVEDTKLLTDDFWNEIQKDSESSLLWQVFEQQRISRQVSTTDIIKGDESRILCQFPIDGTDWHLVMGVNQEYAQYMRDKTWKPVAGLLIGLGICLAGYIVAIVVINVISRIRHSEQKRALENKADTDLLTELSNKIATERMIREYIETHPNKQALMFVLDLDNFKKINDTMGHAFGDEVLRSLGVRLQSMFRLTDIVGRIGGDEFLVFLKDVRDEGDIEREGKKLEQFFRQFEVGEYVKYSVTASIGGAVFPRDADSFEDLYKAADTAVYNAKKLGKNRVAFYCDNANK